MSGGYGTGASQIYSAVQQNSQLGDPSKSETTLGQAQGILNQVLADNNTLYNAPAAVSQETIYGTTYVQAPAHQSQGNTQVYQSQFHPAVQGNDDTDWTQIQAPSFLTGSQTGFQSLAPQSAAYDPTSYGQSVTAGATPQSVTRALASVQSATNVGVSHVGTGGPSAAGGQGATISTPGANGAYTYSLSEDSATVAAEMARTLGSTA